MLMLKYPLLNNSVDVHSWNYFKEVIQEVMPDERPKPSPIRQFVLLIARNDSIENIPTLYYWTV